MKKTEELIRVLCRPYCRYYKQGKNEELLCRGGEVVKILLRSGRIRREMEFLESGDDDKSKGRLIIHLCSSCSFREHDCDFAQEQTAAPCGGFLLLARLLAAGAIGEEDIR